MLIDEAIAEEIELTWTCDCGVKNTVIIDGMIDEEVTCSNCSKPVKVVPYGDEVIVELVEV